MPLLKKIVIIPIVVVAGAVTGVILVALQLDTWADFKAELKSTINFYLERC